MTIKSVILVFLLASMLSTPAHAVKVLAKMTPPLDGKAFSLKMTSQKNGVTKFTITRDPSLAVKPHDDELIISRAASIAMYGEHGLVARVPVAPYTDRSGKLVYTFEINKQLSRKSIFTISEFEDYKDRGGYMGGGTIFEFRLIDFIDPKKGDHALMGHLKPLLAESQKPSNDEPVVDSDGHR